MTNRAATALNHLRNGAFFRKYLRYTNWAPRGKFHTELIGGPAEPFLLNGFGEATRLELERAGYLYLSYNHGNTANWKLNPEAT